MVAPIYTTAVAPVAPPVTPVNTDGLLTAPATYDPTKWNVDANQTVAGQVKGLIDADSPLMERAATRADQQMNKRGLGNSSMAVGAGQAALYDAALPIASADAQINAQAANTNAQAANAASQFNSGAQNTINTQINSINANANTSNADAANKMAMQDLDNQFKTAITNADAGSKAQLQSMADQSKAQLMSIEADYKTLIQTSASASEIYKGTMAQIGPIVSDVNMDAASKASAINGLFSRMSTAMNLVGSINGVDLSDLLDFGTVTAP